MADRFYREALPQGCTGESDCKCWGYGCEDTAPTCRYQGREYAEGEMWELCNAIARDDVQVHLQCLQCGIDGVMHSAGMMKYKQGTLTDIDWSIIEFGDPGDQTPWRALCMAVEKMEATNVGED